MEDSVIPSRNLAEFANRCVGRRAFIIGNGPSLNKLDLTKLKDEFTFGVNSIFYNFDKMGFKPTFYVVEDRLVAQDRREEINSLTGMVKIFGKYMQKYHIQDKGNVIWTNVIVDYLDYPGFPHFSRDAAKCLWVGGTVSYLCMQLAYYMGFDEVYLIGFDHSYVIPSDAEMTGCVITSASDDPNHFHPEYFGKGKRWNNPLTDRMEIAYKRAKEVFEQSGREIYNATAGGKLELFERVDYDRLFDNGNHERINSETVTNKPVPSSLQENPLHTRGNTSCRTMQLERDGAELYAQGDLAGARAAFHQALALAPEDSTILGNLGRIAVDMQRHESALAYFQVATCINPEKIGHQQWVALLAQREKQLETFDLACQQIHRLDPNHPMFSEFQRLKVNQQLKRINHDTSGPSCRKKILLYVDSRGKNISGHNDYEHYTARLAKTFGVDMYLCPEKWTTTLDFLTLCRYIPLEDYDAVVLHTGIVDTSPRHQRIAVERIYAQKQDIFDEVFGEPQIQRYLHTDLNCEYEGDKTINLYSLEMAKNCLLPRLKKIPNLIWIGINRIVPGWNGNYWKPRPANISVIEEYSALFALELDHVVDLMVWDFDDVMRHTFDNMHPNKLGSDYIYEQVCKEIEHLDKRTTHNATSRLESYKESTCLKSQVGPSGNESKPPSVSVIMPCYNTAKYLGEAIESVLAQTYPDFEVIVVDDGSTDNTPQVVQGFDDKRIRYVYQDNKGLAGARNTGIRHARGRYLTFLDADDYFLPNKLADQVAFLEGHPEIGLVAGGYLRVDKERKQFYENKLNSAEMIPVERILVVNVFPVHAMLIRRTWLDRVGLFDESLPAAEDWDLYCRLAILGCKICRTTDVVCAYRFLPGSMSTNAQQQTDSMLRVVEKSFANKELPLSLTVLEPKAKGFTHLKGSVRCFGAGLIDEGRRHLAQALSYDPSLGNNNYKKVIDLLVFWARDHAHFDSPVEYIRCVFDNLPEEARDMQQFRATALHRVMQAGTMVSSSKVFSNASANVDKVDKSKIYEGLNKCYFSEQCDEKEIIDRLPEILDGVKTFVDIGASLGQYTFFANKYMQEAQIFAIEADPIRFEELKRNCSKWELLSTNKLIPVCAAASDKDEQKTFYVTNSCTSGGLFKRDFSTGAVDWHSTTVDCLRLDGFFKDNSPDFVKIDVEGAELRVLKGATRILQEGKTKFLIEVHGGADPEGQKDPEEVFRFMESFGYTRLNFYGRSLFINKVKANKGTIEAKNETVKRENLQMFANKYVGRRAFIIGNGPRLKSMDFTKLKDEITFGVNNIFYHFGQMDFKPTFYVVEDKLVAEDRAEEINALSGMTKIFGTELQYCLKDSQDIIWANVIYDFSNYPGFPNFSKDASQCLWVGGTVSYLCMQLAYYMGFAEVYLVGFDHNYTVPSNARIEGTVFTSASDDPNHFHPEYFGKGKRWHDPRTDRMELAYKRAEEVFEQSGRNIYNATVGGKLTVFPRVDYEGLFMPAKNGIRVCANICSTEGKASSSYSRDKVRVSVVLCTHRNPALLCKTLESLSRQTLDKQSYEVIVVDNNSQDQTRQIVEHYPGVTYVLEEKVGLSHARNTGIENSTGDVIAFIDDDAEADPEWLQALLKVYDNIPEAWAVGGKVLPIWDAERPEWLTEEYFCHLSLRDYGSTTRPVVLPNERIVGTNCSFRNQVFSTLSCFDVNLGRIGSLMFSYEEADLQTRIKEAGHQIYYTNAIVFHHVPSSRMTREYLADRIVGNLMSQMFITLREIGRGREVRQFVDESRQVRDSFHNGLTVSAQEQVLEKFYSTFIQGNLDITPETKMEFVCGVARCYLEHEKYSKAEKKCLEGLSLPNISDAHRCKFFMCLISIYLKQGQEDRAVQKFYEALCTDRIDSKEAHRMFMDLGEYYYGQDELTVSAQEQALERFYSTFVQRYPDITLEIKVRFASVIVKCYLDWENYAKAEKKCLGMISLPNISDTHRCKFLLRLANIYFRQDKHDHAQQKVYEALCTGQIESEEAYQMFRAFGEYYQEQGRYAQMKEKVDEILASQDISEQNKVAAIRYFGEFYSDCGMHDEAERLYLKFLPLDNLENTSKDKLLLGLGELYTKQGRYSEARELIYKAVLIDNIIEQEKARSQSNSITVLNTGNEPSNAQKEKDLMEKPVTSPRKPRFSHLVLDYTRLCNSRCTYCGIWKSKNAPELGLDSIKKTFSSLRSFGLATCYVTGGEPYISDKVVDIARLLHQHLPGSKISGATNGIQPTQIIRRIREILGIGVPVEMHVSINGREATHDATRGSTGFWKKAIYLLETLKSCGVPVKATMSLMPQTIADMPYMQEFCAERDIGLIYSWVRQYARYGEVDEDYSTWPEELKPKLRRIEYLPDEFDCPGLSERLVITPDGSLYPCEVYHPEILLGNVNEESLEAMLNSPRAASIMQMISNKGCYWCQGQGEVDGSPKWMLMDCYRRHSKQAIYLAENFPQAISMSPQQSKQVIEDLLNHRSFHQVSAFDKKQSLQTVEDNNKNEPRISVVICTHRNPGMLAKTLDSLGQQILHRELFEVIVVDNNSQDNTEEVVARCPTVRYILEERLGLSYARNIGVEKARGDIIAFIDDDAEASPEWLQALLKIYDTVQDAWAVGGKVLPIWDSQKPDWLTDEYYRSLSLVEWGENARALRWPERIIGTNCSFRRQVFTDIGFFDTCLGRIGTALLGNEDTEIQQRIHALGHLSYYAPEAVVYHHVTASRMTEEYFRRREQGTKISKAILELRSQGKNHQAEQIAAEVRQSVGGMNASQKKREAPANLISSLRHDTSEISRSSDTGCSQLESSSDRKTVLSTVHENANMPAPALRDVEDVAVLAQQLSCATAKKRPPGDNHVLAGYARHPSEMKWPEDKEDARIVNQASRHAAVYTPQLTASDRIDLLYDEIRANTSRLLMQYKDKYRGQRCVIIGNRPSLNNTDLSLLKNEYTFGLNKIYLLFDRIDWRPTFYVCVNPFVIQQSAQQILNDIPGLKFLDFVSFKYLPYNEDTVHLLCLNGKAFSTDLCMGVFQIHTVTYVAMQLAYHLGFDEVFLVGVDHCYNAVKNGQPDQVVIQNSCDTDHFDPNYFGPGQQWNLPNLKGSEDGYRIAKAAFEKAGKKICDATVGGHLTVFEKVGFCDVFENTENSYHHV